MGIITEAPTTIIIPTMGAFYSILFLKTYLNINLLINTSNIKLFSNNILPLIAL